MDAAHLLNLAKEYGHPAHFLVITRWCLDCVGGRWILVELRKDERRSGVRFVQLVLLDYQSWDQGTFGLELKVPVALAKDANLQIVIGRLSKLTAGRVSVRVIWDQGSGRKIPSITLTPEFFIQDFEKKKQQDQIFKLALKELEKLVMALIVEFCDPTEAEAKLNEPRRGRGRNAAWGGRKRP